MNTTIFAMGGGTIGEHRETYSGWSSSLPFGEDHYAVTTTSVDTRILQATGRQSPKVLLILTASEDGKHDLELFEEAFRKQYEGLGAVVDTLRLITEKTPQETIQQKIDAADAIYVSGGNTWRMMKTWRRLGVDVLLRQAYEHGTVMSGMSAGSICWFDYGVSNSFYTDRPFRVTGMGWFSLTISPHYDMQEFRRTGLKKILKRRPRSIGLSLDEQVAIEIVNDTYRIYDMQPGATAKIHYWKEGMYVSKLLPCDEVYRPIDELLRLQ